MAAAAAGLCCPACAAPPLQAAGPYRRRAAGQRHRAWERQAMVWRSRRSQGDAARGGGLHVAHPSAACAAARLAGRPPAGTDASTHRQEPAPRGALAGGRQPPGGPSAHSAAEGAPSDGPEGCPRGGGGRRHRQGAGRARGGGRLAGGPLPSGAAGGRPAGRPVLAEVCLLVLMERGFMHAWDRSEPRFKPASHD